MGLKRIPLHTITRNPNQPRQEFDEEHISNLAASIRERGLDQPITVRPIDKDDPRWPDFTYEIVMGECRFRAHQLIKADNILANIRRMDDDEMAIAAIVENLQRKNISPLEEARAYARQLEADGWDVDRLAKAVGLGSQPWRITYRTRLLDLAPEHQQLLAGGNISLNAAQEIAKLPHAAQTKVIQRMNSGDIKGDAQVSAAVNAILDGLTQKDIFGDSNKASDKDVATVNRMEAKIQTVAGMVASGWDKGACVVAQRVSPSRAAVLADSIAAIRAALYRMEKDLRTSAAQAQMVMDAAP